MNQKTHCKFTVLYSLIIICVFFTFLGCDISPNNNPDENYFIVTFDPQNGNSTFRYQVEKNSTISYLPSPSRTSYKFSGWYTEKDGHGELFTKEIIITANITLYAKWVPGYRITFNPNGGSVYPETIDIEAGMPIGFLPNPYRSFYIFLGWYDSENNLYDNTTILNKNITLTAKWRTYPSTSGINAEIRGTTVTFTFNLGEGEDNYLTKLVIYMGWMGGPEYIVNISDMIKTLNVNDGSYSSTYFEQYCKYKYTGTLEYTGSDKRYFCWHEYYFDGTRSSGNPYSIRLDQR